MMTCVKNLVLVAATLFAAWVVYFSYEIYEYNKRIPHIIANFGEVSDMEDYAKQHKLDFDVLDESGLPMLVRAVMNVDGKMVKKLISLGADVNVVGRDYDTPLMFAASLRRYEIAKILLEAGADPNYKVLGKYSSPMTLSVTKDGGDVAMLNILVEYGGNANSLFYDDKNLLMVALDNDANIETVKRLVELGNDVNHKNLEGRSVLSYALESTESMDVIEYLIENGAH